MKLTELIVGGELKKALDVLEEKSKGFDADFSNDIVILRSRLNRYLQKKVRRTEPDNTLEITLNQLTESICDLAKEFESQYGPIEILELEVKKNNLKKTNESQLDENENESDNNRVIKMPKSWLYLNRIGLLGVILGYLYLGWLFYKLPPLSEFGFFSANSKPKSEKVISDPIKHISQVGLDKSSKKLHVFIDILDQQFTWQKNGITAGQYIYDGHIINLREYFKDQLYLDKINESLEIICLGNASFEESLAIPIERRKSEEETRALARARNLRDIVKSLLKNVETPVYILNLGKHKFEKKLSSNLQRSIVIIRILEKEIGVNTNQALYDALTKSIEMPFKITDFTLIEKDSVELSLK